MADTKLEKKTVKSGKPEKKANKKKNIFVRFAQYMKEVAGELKKLTWVTPKELLSYTATVIAFVAIIAVVIGLLDYAFGQGLALLAKL